jgi:hypothetical protein
MTFISRMMKIFKSEPGAEDPPSRAPKPSADIPAQQTKAPKPVITAPKPREAPGSVSAQPGKREIEGGQIPQPSLLATADILRTSSMPDFSDRSEEFPELKSIKDAPGIFPEGLPQTVQDSLLGLGPKVLEFKNFYQTGSGIPAQRIRIAKACEAMQRDVSGIIAQKVILVYKYSPSSRAKCIRDLGLMLNWAIYAMLLDDKALLEKHVLEWVRGVFHLLKFPGGTQSVTMAYMKLRKEVLARLPEEDRPVMEPYLSAIVNCLSHGQVK